jgi:hypothetical protein
MHINEKLFPRFKPFFTIIFAIAVTLIASILILGLDGWPTGQSNIIPRVIPLFLLIISWLICICSLIVWAKSKQKCSAWLFPLIASLIFGFGSAWGIYKVVRWRAAIWMADYLLSSPEPYKSGTRDVLFCFVDHFEPDGIWSSAEKLPLPRRIRRMRNWESSYAAAVDSHLDSDGRSPQHTWFFPIQHSTSPVTEILSQWPRKGWGEIEYHLHHGRKWDANQVHQQIVEDLSRLRSLGACTHGFAFVHGRFALAAGDLAECLVTNELDLLKETGCYADFSFPNLYTPAQPSQVNSIFYARSTGKAKPHNRGPEVQFSNSIPDDGLMLIQGAMWMGFTKSVFDDSNLSLEQIPDPSRIDHWLASHVHVKGQANWIFFIVHSHSASENAQKMLWGGNMQHLWSALESRFKKAPWRLHYVSAREAYNIVKAAQAGKTGNPNDYRDYIILPPDNRKHAIQLNLQPIPLAKSKKE